MESLTSNNKSIGSANKVSAPSQDPSTALAPASSESKTDKFSANGWTSEDGGALLTKFKCHICRNNEHTWPTCPHLVHWNINRKDCHPRKNNQSNSDSGVTSGDKGSGDKGNKVGKSCAVTCTTPEDVFSPPDQTDEDITADDIVDPASFNVENADPLAPLGHSECSDTFSSAATGTHCLGKGFHIKDTVGYGLCVVDSGASKHMTNYRAAFVTFRKTPDAYVEVATGAQAPCLGVGAAMFYVGDKLILLPDVLFVPSLTNCLLSVPRLRECHPDCGFISLQESYLKFPDFRVNVNDDDECTVPINFLRFVPSPFSNIDFNYFGSIKIPINAGTACPVLTRGMSKAFLQAPLPPSPSPPVSVPADPAIRPPSDPAVPPSTSSPSKPTTSTPYGRLHLPVCYKQFSSAPKSVRLTTQQLHQYLGCRSLKNWKTLDEFVQPTVPVSDLGENMVELGDVVNLKSTRKNNVLFHARNISWMWCMQTYVMETVLPLEVFDMCCFSLAEQFGSRMLLG